MALYYSGKDGKKIIRNSFPHHMLMENFHVENKYIHNIDDRVYWEGITQEQKNIYVKEAEKYLDFTWKSVRVMETYYDYFVHSNHSHLSDGAFLEKREALLWLTIAECIENKGRFIKQIVNGIFSLCEQSTWAPASHFRQCGETKEWLPDPDDPVLDLYACIQGMFMSITYALLKNRLDEISPVICKRIEKEMDKRIITPFLTRDVWWMAENLDLSFWNINNWTTACCYDILFIILAMKYDKKTAFKAINKAIDCMDVFVDSYPDDGACDEGPGYWGGSIHNLMSFLELLEHVIGGKTNIWKQRKLEQMCEYILHMRIHNGIYASVADSHPHIEVNLSRLLMMYHEGKLFDNEAMMQEAIQLYPLLESEKRYPYDFMTEFTYWEEIKNGIAKPSDVPKSAWISGIEFLSSHECIDTGKGMYLGIKGGTNMESHNHNDIGSFIVYKNGKPVIVDAGIGLYTNTTFGEKRYTNWWANGFHHNIPVIGGVEQIEGAYSAKDVSCSLSEAEDSVCMELTDAYRNSDKIKKLFRKAVLNRTNSHVIVEDTFEFTDTIEYASVLLLYHEPKITPSGFGCGEADIQIEGPEYEIEVTDIDLSYDSIFCGEENWNTNTLYRVLIRFKSSAKSNVRITIS